MKKVYFLRLGIIAVMVMWMSVIFGFSSADGIRSQGLSDKVTLRIIEFTNDNYETMNEEEQQGTFNSVSFAVRKTAHFCEYAVLGALMASLLYTFEKIRSRKIKLIPFISKIFCMAYAVTDEIHQGFVNGRSPKIFDVCVDTCGGFVGAAIITLMLLIIFKARRRNKNERMGAEH